MFIHYIFLLGRIFLLPKADLKLTGKWDELLRDLSSLVLPKSEKAYRRERATKLYAEHGI